MINLLVDEAYAFDYLAILEVKKNLYCSEQKENTHNECKQFLLNQLKNFKEIIISKEYKDLYDINLFTFNLIDKLREGKEITALEIDNANMERFYKKKALQDKFFTNPLTEEKITK
jgi:hypothetical protein